jgi:hypothetical protein
MPHPIRQVAGVFAGSCASLLIYYVILSLAMLVVAGEFGGSFAETSRALTAHFPTLPTRQIIIATMALSAVASGGYVAAWLGGGPSVPLGAFSSLIVIGLFLRAWERASNLRWTPVSVAIVASVVAGAAFGGYLRHRQLERRERTLPVW